MRKEKLAFMPYANAYVIINDENTKILISYTTEVCSLTSDGWFSITGLYSATTRKHISAFMKEYTDYGYYTAKEAYEGGYDINLYTGEILLHE